MHFAKTYAEAAKDLPEEWQPYLISYKALKKCIGRIVKELEGRGLSVELLKELQERSAREPRPPQECPAPLRLPDASRAECESDASPAAAVRAVPSSSNGKVEGYQQVLLDTDRQKLLYTFSDSSHPCLVVIVNEQPDVWSADPTPMSTPPASPALSPCAQFAVAEATENSDCQETCDSEASLAHILSERLSELDLEEAAEVDNGRHSCAVGSLSDASMATLVETADSEETEKDQQQDYSDNDYRDDEEDRAHEEREQDEMDRHFAARGVLGALVPASDLPAYDSSLDFAFPVVELKPADQRHAVRGEPSAKRPKFDCCVGSLAAPPASLSAAESAPSPATARTGYRAVRSRRQSRRVYTTIYADDGQAVRIARGRRSDKGRSSGDPGESQYDPPNEPVAAAAAIMGGEPPPSFPSSSCSCSADAVAASAFVASPAAAGSTKAIKVTLLTDVDFFNTILTAITRLGEFQNAIKTVYDQRIWRIAGLVAAAATPTPQQGRGSTFGFGRAPSDMYAWREIMATFAEEEIWFDGNGVVMCCDTAKLEKCRSRFGKWERLASERCLPKFKLQKSKVAFADFLKLNRELLAMKQFRELNKMAIGKILKKHDKRTRLICRAGFEGLIAQNSFIHDSLTHSLCCAVATRLMTIVPQPQDYSCPVCMSISWKPIRLACGHVFCVRCLIKAQRRKMTNCPLCRSKGSVAQATADNLDVPLMNLLRLYFPTEVKEKRRENARELLETDGHY